uniref:Uncharacterized protein n=1 Tax=viral metagenome TaxID=1070528 RepID=A0A6M3LD93_9ZZZZ
MQVVLSRVKTQLLTDVSLNYIKRIEYVSPRLLPEIPLTMVPYIGIAPMTTSESWVAQRKQQIHTFELYCVEYIRISEDAIFGSSASGKKGILEIVEDVSTSIRAKFLTDSGVHYLSKPTGITNIDYVVAGYGDNVYLIVATIVIQCAELLNVTAS